MSSVASTASRGAGTGAGVQGSGRLSNGPPQRHQVSVSGNCECYLPWQSGFKDVSKDRSSKILSKLTFDLKIGITEQMQDSVQCLQTLYVNSTSISQFMFFPSVTLKFLIHW